ncbi:MAG: DUF362 domain-containing protein [Candidatus Zixiibacteriota bacterium]|nr:MAG: DUF362 domain-containing protein [candidate division Zixibacteria bacterium]
MSQRPRVRVIHRPEVPGSPAQYDERALAVVQDMVLQAAGGEELARLVRGRSVLIKPNLVRPHPQLPVTTTDPRVIISLLRLCREAGAREIGLGDKPGIGLSCRAGERLLNLGEHLAAVKAHFVYFDESPETWEENPHARLCSAVPVPDVLRRYEVLINLPKLKFHMHTGVSLGIKNLFGLVPEHFRLKHHREDLHRFLVDYLYLVKPDLTLIDGLWAMEGQAPICGTPVQDFNTLVASADVVAADALGAYLMGLDTTEVAMIRMAAAEGLGVARLEDMHLIGTSPETIRRHLRRPVLSSQEAYPGIDVLVRGACVGCQSSLRHALDRLHAAGKLREDPATIILGARGQIERPALKEEPGLVWCYGNCALDLFIKYFEGMDTAHHLPGCPPHFMELYRLYCLAQGLDPA